MTKLPRMFNKERTVFSTNGAGKTGCSHAKKNEAKPIFVSYTEINSTWIPDLKLKL